MPVGLTFSGDPLSSHAIGLGTRARCKVYFFYTPAIHFSRTGWVSRKESRRLSALSGVAFGMHASGLGIRARGALFHFSLSPSNFHGLGGGGEIGVPAGSTLSDRV